MLGGVTEDLTGRMKFTFKYDTNTVVREWLRGRPIFNPINLLRAPKTTRVRMIALRLKITFPGIPQTIPLSTRNQSWHGRVPCLAGWVTVLA